MPAPPGSPTLRYAASRLLRVRDFLLDPHSEQARQRRIEGRVHPYSCARMGTSIAPRPAKSRCMVSPGRTRLTPSQVPDMMMSPGWRV